MSSKSNQITKFNIINPNSILYHTFFFIIHIFFIHRLNGIRQRSFAILIYSFDGFFVDSLILLLLMVAVLLPLLLCSLLMKRKKYIYAIYAHIRSSTKIVRNTFHEVDAMRSSSHNIEKLVQNSITIFLQFMNAPFSNLRNRNRIAVKQLTTIAH